MSIEPTSTDTPATFPTHPERPWTLFGISEFAANWLTHGLGLLLALIGAPFLVVLAAKVGNQAHMVACGVYGLSLILLYAASTRFHFYQAHPGQEKPGEYRRLILDHICIYFLIAGTYTAYCIVMLRGEGFWAWAMLIAIWALAFTGTIFKLIFGLRYARLSLIFYIAMGWMALASVWPLIHLTPTRAVVFILIGGFFYTFGTIFYARVWIGKVRYSHAVWHLAVVAGSAMHWLAVRECLLVVGKA